MRKRHDPAAALTAEPAMLYRCGTRGKWYKTKHGAYMAEAARIFYSVHPGGSGLERENRLRCTLSEEGWEHHDRRDKLVIRRLARFLRWHDGRRAALELTTEALLDELAQRLNMQRPEACELMRLAEQELVR